MVLKMMNIANKDLPRLIAALFHIEVLRLAQNISLFGLSSFELPSDMFDEKSTSSANPGRTNVLFNFTLLKMPIRSKSFQTTHPCCVHR